MKTKFFIIIISALIAFVAFLLYSKLKKADSVIKNGDPAPLFSLPASDGKVYSLSEKLGKKVIVLFFYPKDFSPGCTTEVCTFRDAYDVFSAAGAEVVGISSDNIESHLKFIKEHSLPFILLSDEKGEVRKLYKTGSTAGIIPGRVTFVIDQSGIVKNSFSSQFDAKKHIEEALKIVKELKLP